MNLSDVAGFDGHESVTYITDKKTGLRAFIAIHSTKRGPATGGTRYAAYESEEAALTDALRLSRAMSYKCALARVPYGGGKAVIIKDPHQRKSKELLIAYAKAINDFHGKYTTGEDVGITDEDLTILQKHSPFIHGRPKGAGELGPWAARGTFEAMRAALKHRYGRDALSGRTVLIQGAGKVGGCLIELVREAGGTVIAADSDPKRVKQMQQKYKDVRWIHPDAVYKTAADVFSPCAMGGVLSSKTIKQLRCGIVCGAANNQLARPTDAELLRKRGIIYVPDYVANAGGLINITAEMRKGGYSRTWVLRKVCAIRQTTTKILDRAKQERCSPSVIADRIAEAMIGIHQARKKA
jgi:leucine dehydrogenase